MAEFQEHNRLSWNVTMTLAEGAAERVLTVHDDGWSIRLADPYNDDRTVFIIHNGNMDNRKPDRGSAMAFIRTHCGWWMNNRELFEKHPDLWND